MEMEGGTFTCQAAVTIGQQLPHLHGSGQECHLPQGKSLLVTNQGSFPFMFNLVGVLRWTKVTA